MTSRGIESHRIASNRNTNTHLEAAAARRGGGGSGAVEQRRELAPRDQFGARRRDREALELARGALFERRAHLNKRMNEMNEMNE